MFAVIAAGLCAIFTVGLPTSLSGQLPLAIDGSDADDLFGTTASRGSRIGNRAFLGTVAAAFPLGR